MRVTALKTPIIHTGDDLQPFIVRAIREQVGTLPERSIIAISSKVISYSQGRVVSKTVDDLRNPVANKAHKEALAQQEADWYVPSAVSRYGLLFTITNHTLAVNAGIDESNAQDAFILWPKELPSFLADLWQKLRTEFSVQELGLVVTDSKTYPLRWGVTATCLGHCGFKALYDCRGKKDLFGREMQMEQVNVAEAVAMSASLEMGEVAESQPFALVESVTMAEFQDRPPTAEELAALVIDPADDFFGPLLTAVEWRKK